MPVQTQVRLQTPQLRVLVTHLPKLPQLVQPQAGILLLPKVKRLLADPVLAADFQHRVTRVASRNTRRISYSLFPFLPITALLSSFQRTIPAKILNFNLARLWVLGQ